MNTVDLQAPDQPSAKPLDPEAYALEAAIRSLIQLGASHSPRNQQSAIGISQAGQPCDRQLVFRANQTQPTKLVDPLASLIGIGFHMAMAELFRRLDAGTGRFLVEQPVTAYGIPGTFDLYDHLQQTLFDWKTTTLARIKNIRANGPKNAHVVQLQLYAYGLKNLGHDVRQMALVYVPVDSTLDDTFVWRTTPETAVVEQAVSRVEKLGLTYPAEVQPNPSPLCNWCVYHNPKTVNDNLSCKGQDK